MTTLTDLDRLAETDPDSFGKIHKDARKALRGYLGDTELDFVQADLDLRVSEAHPKRELTITILAPGLLVVLRSDSPESELRALEIRELTVRAASPVFLQPAPVATGATRALAVSGTDEPVDWAASVTLTLENGAAATLILGNDAGLDAWNSSCQLRLVLGDRVALVAAVARPQMTYGTPAGQYDNPTRGESWSY